MEINQLYYFRTLAKMEHFTQAAEQLHITQPSLSKSLANLERELGAKLFDRVGKQVHLNATGRAFLERVTRILSELEEAKEMVADMTRGVWGALRLGSSIPITAPSPIHAYLYFFFAEHPKVSQHISVHRIEQIEELLLDRKLDFGVTLAPPVGYGIDWYRLYTDELGIVVGPNHPFARRRTVKLEEFKEERFLCNSSAPDPRDTTRFLCGLAGYEPNIIYEGADSRFIGEAVAADYGVSFVSKARYEMFQNDDRRAEWERGLYFLSLEDDFCYRPVFICFLTGRSRPKVAQIFYDGLLEYCSSLVPSMGLRANPHK